MPSERRGHRIRSGGKGRLRRIADDLEEDVPCVSMAARKSVTWRATAAAIPT